MTLDKHSIQGLSAFTTKTLHKSEFEKRMINAGYFETGTAPAQGGRIKVWWAHDSHELNPFIALIEILCLLLIMCKVRDRAG